MKLASEVVHEVLGHGTFIIAFGGSIQSICITMLWPYELSYITPSWPAAVTELQLAFFYLGGILLSLAVSYSIQLSLFRKGTSNLWLELSLFWLAFWSPLNATGYLIIGGFFPFGDMMWLTSHGFITPIAAVLIGAVFFLLGFFLLLPILKRNFAKVFTETRTRLAVPMFWLTLPIVVALAILGTGTLSLLAFLPVSLIPLILSLVEEYMPARKSE